MKNIIIFIVCLVFLSMNAIAQNSKISTSDFTISCNCSLEENIKNSQRQINSYQIIENGIGGMYSISVKAGNKPSLMKSYLDNIKENDKKIHHSSYSFKGQNALLGKYNSIEQGNKMYWYSLLFYKGDKFYTVMIGAFSQSDLEKVFNIFKSKFTL